MVRKKRLSLFDSDSVTDDSSVAVIGLGRFGQAVALELMATGAEVLGIDEDPEIVQQLNNKLTHVVCASATNFEVLEQLDVTDFDRIVVAIGTHLESSILVTSYLLRQGVENIWAKAVSDQHGIILQQLGVRNVVFPEKDMGKRVAHLLQGGLQEFIQIDREYALAMARVPEKFAGSKVSPSAMFEKYGVGVTSYRDGSGQWHQELDDDVVVEEGNLMILGGSPQKIEHFAKKYL